MYVFEYTSQRQDTGTRQTYRQSGGPPGPVNQQLLDSMLPSAGRAGRQYGQTRRLVEE